MQNIVARELLRKRVERANRMLAADNTSLEFRRGVIEMIEHDLQQHNAYRGFKYLTAAEVGEGCQPGIRYGVPTGKDQFENTDSTRISYLIPD